MNAKKTRYIFLILFFVLFSIGLLNSCARSESDESTLSLQTEIAPPVAAENDIDKYFQTKEFVSEDGNVTLPYRLHIPDSDVGAIGKYPLLLYLHGSGERGSDNQKHIAYNTPFEMLVQNEETAGQFPCIIIAPQCPDDKYWEEYDIITALTALVKTSAEELDVDMNRIYVTGISMGGYGSFGVLLYEPDLFAAAVPICGGSSYGNIANNIKDIPIWAFHAADDDTVSVENTRIIVKDLEELGQNENMKYTEFQTGGHGIWIDVYKDVEVFEWMFMQAK